MACFWLLRATLLSTLSIALAAPTGSDLPIFTCEAGNFTAGENASVTCHSNKNIERSQFKVHVTKYPFGDNINSTDVVVCIAPQGNLECNVEGYHRTKVISEKLIFEIPKVTADFAGRYACQYSPADEMPTEICILAVSDANTPRPRLPDVENSTPAQVTTSTRPFVDSSSVATTVATPAATRFDFFALLVANGCVLLLVISLAIGFGVLHKRRGRPSNVPLPPVPHNTRRLAAAAVLFRPVPPALPGDNDSLENVTANDYDEIPEDIERIEHQRLTSDATPPDDYLHPTASRVEAATPIASVSTSERSVATTSVVRAAITSDESRDFNTTTAVERTTAKGQVKAVPVIVEPPYENI